MNEITLFAQRGDNEPKRVRSSWDELVESLSEVEGTDCTLATCARSECPHKDGLAWSPAVWPEGALRKKADVESVNYLVYDCDHLTDDQHGVLVETLENWTSVLYATHSDRPGDRCSRVVFKLTRPLSKLEYVAVWPAVVAQLAIPVDHKAKDASRLFYTPRRPRDACADVFDGTGYDFGCYEGQVVDVDAILKSAPPVKEEPRSAIAIPRFTGAPSEEGFEEAVQILGSAWPSQGRHPAQLALSGALAHQGWPVQLIGEFCAAVAEVEEPGNGDLAKRLSAARSSVEKASSGDLVTGWPSVAERVGEEAVARACIALGIGVEGKAAQLGDFKERITARVKERQQLALASSRAGDALVVQRLSERVVDPPTILDIETDLEIARDKMKKSRDPDKRRDAKLLQLILQGKYLAEHADDRRKAMEQAAVAVARIAREGTTREQILKILLPCAGLLAQDLPSIVDFALDVAEEAGPVVLPGDNPKNKPEDLPPPADDDELRAQLATTRDGDPQSVGHNVERVIRYCSDLKELLRFNSLTKEVEITGGRFVEEGVDGLPVGIKNWLGSHWGIHTTTSEVAEQMLRIARTWCEYNPVAEYLESLEWDGVRRLGDSQTKSWLASYCLADDTNYARQVGSRYLVAAVARALDPGCKVDNVLILEGDQGVKKSMTFAILGGAWSSDTPLVIGDKDSRLMAACKWIIELAELKSLLRDEDASKGFLSQRLDYFRPPYGRGPQEFQRCCIFGGSTNEREYLPDQTGNRRYWAVRVGRCDADALRRDRDQLWAEAVYRYKSAELNAHLAHSECPGERWWFQPEEEAAMEREISSRRTDDPWVSVITAWHLRTCKSVGTKAPKQWFTMAEIALDALDMSPEGMRRNSQHIGKALRAAGFDRMEMPGSEGREWVWVKKGTVVNLRQAVDEGSQDRPAGSPSVN